MAGMLANLALAAPHYGDDEIEGWEGLMDDVLASVAVDFGRLQAAGTIPAA
jgi:hypothetical protein